MFRAISIGRSPFSAARRYSKITTMSLKVCFMSITWRALLTDPSYQAISAKDAASLDKDLMDMGGWSLDQLMELAGLSVSQAG